MDSRQDQDRSLTNTTAQTEIEKVASLRLIADSVAQQRQVAANALIRHPLWLGLMTIALAVTYQCLHTDCSDWPIILMTWTGCIMTGLTVVRFLTAPYLDQAEKTGTWKWLYDGIEKSGDKNKKTDHILITKFGSEIVGVLVLRPVYTRSELKSHIQGAQEMGTQSMSLPVAVIRAWTVQRRYRGQGVGMDLLDRAVETSRDRGWDGPVFSDQHANSGTAARWVFEDRERGIRERLRSTRSSP